MGIFLGRGLSCEFKLMTACLLGVAQIFCDLNLVPSEGAKVP